MKKYIFFLMACLSLCLNAGAFVPGWGGDGDNCCCDETPPFYGEFFGGANFIESSKRRHVKADFDTGYILSGSIGYRWCYGLRLEFEYAYRRNNLRKVHVF